MKTVKGLEYLCCEVRLRELGFFILENKRLQGDFLMAFQYIKKAYEKNRERLFFRACSDRTSGK